MVEETHMVTPLKENTGEKVYTFIMDSFKMYLSSGILEQENHRLKSRAESPNRLRGPGFTSSSSYLYLSI
jgi:hypothetical protein